jgi:carbamoyl-phosphate synthase small subunit
VSTTEHTRDAVAPDTTPASRASAGTGGTRRGGAAVSGWPVPLIGANRAARPAVLMLEDGRCFVGESFGATGESFGEAVFATGMTGYQETLSDPSFRGQIVVMTAPHIGNTGVNDIDYESRTFHVAGFVVREPSRVASSWRAQRGLDEELAAAGVVGVSGIDTRALTRHLREAGAMRCGVASGDVDQEALLARVRASPSMVGADLAPAVSTPEPYLVPAAGGAEPAFRVAALDLGIKRATPAAMSALGIETRVMPAWSTTDDLLESAPNGVFVSNGPGDPAAADYAVAALRGVLERGVPVFGICFGNQVLARALGFDTYKLTYGHRGVNQPVADRATGRIAVTSHNHGFAVQADIDGWTDTPFGRVQVSHLALNDGVVEGLSCLDVPAFSVQFHPEAAPGPHDAHDLFARFRDLMAHGGREWN